MNAEKSVLKQIQASRWYKKWWGMSLIGIVLVGGTYALFKDSFVTATEDTNPPQYYTVQNGDIRISVEGEGKIINPNIVNLSFLINGTLDSVQIEEGGKVKKGDLLAELEKQEYEFALQEAQNQVQIVNANIRSKQAEIINDDIRVAQNDLIVSQQNLELARQDLEQSLTQALDLGSVELETAFPEIKKALESVDDIFAIDKNRSIYSPVATAFNNSILQNKVEENYREISREREALWQEYLRESPLEEGDISRFLWKTKELAIVTQNLLEDVLDLFVNVIPSSIATASDVDAAESMIRSSFSSINGEVNALTTARQKIDNAYLAQETGLKNAENSLRSTQIKLENSENTLSQRETSKETSLSVLYAQLAQAQIKVEKAKYDLGLTSLLAPIDGEVIAVNGNPGETVKVESTSSDSALVRILSDANFTTEIYVEEIDIAKIKKGQRALVTLDAIEDVELEGEVSYIASTATTDNNGITTYLVRINIVNTEDTPIKEGMSTYVEFLLENAEDVPLVPITAVTGGKVQLEDGTFVDVETGVTDGRNIEIKNGITAGQVIISNPSTASGSRRRSESGSSSAEDRMEKIGAILKEQGTLPKGWDSMSTNQKQAAVQAIREGKNGEGNALGGFGGGRPAGGGGRPR